jgi:hypothetical protein
MLTAVNRKIDSLVGNQETVMKDLRQYASDFSEMKKEQIRLAEDNAHLVRQVQYLGEQVDRLEGQMRKKNLLLGGILEEARNETPEDCEKKVRDILENVLGICDNIQLDRTHRIGRKTRGKTRPIIMRFSFLHDRDRVLRLAREKKPANIFFSEDFPLKTRQARRELHPHLLQARNSGKTAYLRHDRLIIDGQTFTLEAGALKLVGERVETQGDQDQTTPHNPRGLIRKPDTAPMPPANDSAAEVDREVDRHSSHRLRPRAGAKPKASRP